MRRLVVVLLVVAGCGLDPGGAYNGGGGGATIGGGTATSSSTEDATDQSSQLLCPSTSSLLAGAHAAGDVCSSPSDCASTCCDCGTGGTDSWLSASCVAGHCIDSVTSCSRTFTRYCGSSSGGGVTTPTTSTHVCGSTPATTACDTCIDTKRCTASIACHNGACSQLDTCTTSTCSASCGE